MRKIVISYAAIALLFACDGDDAGDGAIWLTAGANPDCGRGNRIVFERYGDIYYCDEYGGNLTQVTNTETIYEDNPCWSPDGNYIAYDAKGYGQTEKDIYVIALNGSDPTRLTFGGGESPAWSPDGDYIAYLNKLPGDIWTIRGEGGTPSRVTTRGRCGAPCWAPDGERLAFHGPDPKDSKGPLGLWYITRDGTRTGRLTAETLSWGEPAWGPGGEWIATEIPVGPGNTGTSQLWAVNVKTRAKSQITKAFDYKKGAWEIGATSPSWFRDGKKIAFWSDRGPTGIFRITLKD